MTSMDMDEYQLAAVEAFRRLSTERQAHAEISLIDQVLIYQAPLPDDDTVSGMFFVVEPDRSNVLLYLTLPHRIGIDARAEAAEFVARMGFGLRFGALELERDEGMLRVRGDIDATLEELPQKVSCLFERTMALARRISPDWQMLCGRQAAAQANLEDYRLR
jgi:hypothetical protein